MALNGLRGQVYGSGARVKAQFFALLQVENVGTGGVDIESWQIIQQIVVDQVG